MNTESLPHVGISQKLKEAGASMPIDQRGVRPGVRRLAQFRLACEYAGVPKLYEGNGVARVRIFDPAGSWSWHIAEFDPETNEAYGVVHGDCHEAGPFCLKELAFSMGRTGIGMELDNWFKATPVEELLK